jgi:hypothetical protein
MTFKIQLNIATIISIISSVLCGGSSYNSSGLCGTWVPYNPNNNLGYPTAFGVSAGKYKDGSNVFVGRGFNVAARIKDVQPGAGLYYTSSSNGDPEQFSILSGEFLLSNVPYDWLPRNTFGIYPDAIAVLHPKWGLQPAARINVDGYYVIGQVESNVIYYPREQPDGSIIVKNSTNFEVLVCKD